MKRKKKIAPHFISPINERLHSCGSCIDLQIVTSNTFVTGKRRFYIGLLFPSNVLNYLLAILFASLRKCLQLFYLLYLYFETDVLLEIEKLKEQSQEERYLRKYAMYWCV